MPTASDSSTLRVGHEAYQQPFKQHVTVLFHTYHHATLERCTSMRVNIDISLMWRLYSYPYSSSYGHILTYTSAACPPSSLSSQVNLQICTHQTVHSKHTYMFRRIEHLIRPFLCSERLRLRCVEHRAAPLHLPAGLELWITEVHTRLPGEVRVLLHRFGATDMVVGLACLGNGDAFIIMSSSHVNLYRFMVGMHSVLLFAALPSPMYKAMWRCP